MLKVALISVMSLLISNSSFATTAILCGEAEIVDADNDEASVWVILDNPDSASPDEVRVDFYGKSAEVMAVNRSEGKLTIGTSKPSKTLIFNEEDVDDIACDGDINFSMTLDSKDSSESINDCRCFAD